MNPEAPSNNRTNFGIDIALTRQSGRKDVWQFVKIKRTFYLFDGSTGDFLMKITLFPGKKMIL